MFRWKICEGTVFLNLQTRISDHGKYRKIYVKILSYINFIIYKSLICEGERNFQ